MALFWFSKENMAYPNRIELIGVRIKTVFHSSGYKYLHTVHCVTLIMRRQMRLYEVSKIYPR